MSTVGWIDFSSEDRQRVQEVLALMKEKGTLDELGIGQVRDAFSDILFPGFSTIQTSSRYFLTVPKILLNWANLTRTQRNKTPLPDYLTREENALAQRLVENHNRLNLSLEGIIGHTLVGKKDGVARLPSSTYWNGMRVFGIVQTEDSLSEFCGSWDPHVSIRDPIQAEEGSDDEEARLEVKVWRPPGAPKAWPTDLTLKLTNAEAKSLSGKFLGAADQRNSVVTQLIKNSLIKQAVKTDLRRFDTFCDWAQSRQKLSKECRLNLERAKNFSLAMEGAHIVYNRLLAGKTGNDELTGKCVERMANWRFAVIQADIFHSGADHEWLSVAKETNVHVRQLTQDFLLKWNTAMCGRALDSTLDNLVTKQAKDNKPNRTLLVKPPQKKETWYGMDTLDYRWRNARSMLIDLSQAGIC